MISFLKEHPWRSGTAAAVIVLAGALAVVMYVRRGEDHAQPAAEHTGHADRTPASSAGGEHAGHGVASTPQGFEPVALEPAQAAAMGLTTAVVGERDFNRKLRTVGVVTLDETRTAHVHARVRGFIEGFHVQYVGSKVRKGQPLVSLYSQEAYAAQLELASIARSPVKSPELLEAARKRLALWEVPRSIIEQVEATGEPQRTFPVLAPRTGVVVAKQAFDGLFIDPSLELYTITDLSRVWVLADIYEADVAVVRPGSTANLTIEGRPAPVTAAVAFLYPTIDEPTRTRKARFEVPNPDGAVLPGAFVTVELELAIGRGLAVPEPAVIRTGERAIVFVVHGTHAEPREVTLGSLVGDHYRVEAGLAAGERVATGAQFLLDSESRLRASSGMGAAMPVTEVARPRLGLVARIIDGSARKRVFVFGATIALAIWGLVSARRSQLDALPDLSDTQVIVATEWMGRNPNLIEAQVTYPIATAFLGAPHVKTVRGFTMFGMSFVYVVFEDGTDLYWARSRVVEYLARVGDELPPGVTPQIGPDATSVGWIYQYALVDTTGKHTLQDLRSFQDWSLRYWLQSVPGVAEVASVGGFEKQYQIEIDPTRMKARNVSVGQIAAAVRGANTEVGGRVIELAQHEYALRGRGYVTSVEDLQLAVVATDARGTPIRIRDVADVTIGGNIRRGLVELDGRGEVVGGIVVMRSGENALNVIERVKAKLEQVRASLPPGVEVVPVYDRSQLIRDSIDTLGTNLVQILATVIAVIAVFLFHFRSALVAAITLPIASASTFIAFYYLDVTINIMSLAGVILALGDMVDSACVLVENAHKKIEAAEREARAVDRKELVIESARELGPSIFGALLVLTLAFLPVFALQGEEGRLFRPLALAKTFSMAFASLFAVTLVPALMVTLLRGRIRPEARNPINRFFIAAYRPLLRACLRARYFVIAAVVALLALTALPFSRLGSEFMPPLYEEDLLYMPITVPGISIAEAKRLLTWQDQQIRSVPEVDLVFGKAGRAESALDPAPLSMFETVVHLRPRGAWRPGMTVEKIIAELDVKTRLPGVQGAWTMPIKARIDMLSTGIRTPIGIKVFGPDLQVISQINDHLERTLRAVPHTRSVYAERELGGFFIDVTPDRQQIARYGLTVAEVLDVVESSIGGMDVATTYEGRERYKVNVRYPRELRDNVEKLRAVLVPIGPLSSRPLPTGGAAAVPSMEGAPAPMVTGGAGMSGGGMGGSMAGGMRSGAGVIGAMSSSGMEAGGAMASPSPGGRAAPTAAFVPLGQLAKLETVMGPPMIKSELGSINGWVYVDIDTSDVGGYVDAAKAKVAAEVQLPPGYWLKWTGQYELLERVRARMSWILPLTIAVVFAILYLNFRGAAQSLIVMTSVPFAAVGAIWMLWAFGFNTSIAVWVGMIALLGVAAETASVMVVYLDEAWQVGRAAGTLTTKQALLEHSLEAATKRVRPLLMTVLANVFGLLPILFDDGVGSDLAKRIALPMWGGLVSLTILTLFVIPAVYVVWRGFHLRRNAKQKLGSLAAGQPGGPR